MTGHCSLVTGHSLLSLVTAHSSLVTKKNLPVEDEIGIENPLDFLLQTDAFGRQFEGQQVLFHKADAMLPGNRAPHGKDQLKDGLYSLIDLPSIIATFSSDIQMDVTIPACPKE